MGLCKHEAVVEPEILVEKCSPPKDCELVAYQRSVFLQLIDLDTTKEPRCGPGDCGAQTHALQSGWEPGRWRIVAPRIPRFPHLVPPEPIDVTLEAGQTHEIQLVYRDRLKGWPRGPFAHNCSPQNADGKGDFDGDGSQEGMRFEPVFDADGHAGWTTVLGGTSRFLESSRSRVDAECPEVIGAADVDQDGDDELFFDTGRGMTAALVDLLVYERGKLRQVTYRPKGTALYIGTSIAGRSDLTCFPTEGTPLFEIVTVDEQRQRVTSTTFSLRDRVLVKTGTFPVRGDASGRLQCFGLRWRGY